MDEKTKEEALKLKSMMEDLAMTTTTEIIKVLGFESASIEKEKIDAIKNMIMSSTITFMMLSTLTSMSHKMASQEDTIKEMQKTIPIQ